MSSQRASRIQPEVRLATPRCSLRGMELAIPSSRSFVAKSALVDCQKPLPPLPLQPRKVSTSSVTPEHALSDSWKRLRGLCDQDSSRTTADQGHLEVVDLTDQDPIPTSRPNSIRDRREQNDIVSPNSGEGLYLLQPRVFQPQNKTSLSRSSRLRIACSDRDAILTRSELLSSPSLASMVEVGDSRDRLSTADQYSFVKSHTTPRGYRSDPFIDTKRFCGSWQDGMRRFLSCHGLVECTSSLHTSRQNELEASSDEALYPGSNHDCCAHKTHSDSETLRQAPSPCTSTVDLYPGGRSSSTSADSDDAQDFELNYQSLLNEQHRHSPSLSVIHRFVQDRTWPPTSKGGQTRMRHLYHSCPSDSLALSKTCDKPKLFSDGESYPVKISLTVPRPYTSEGSRSSGNPSTSINTLGDTFGAESLRRGYLSPALRIDGEPNSTESKQRPAESQRVDYNYDNPSGLLELPCAMDRNRPIDPWQQKKKKVMRGLPASPRPPRLSTNPLSRTLDPVIPVLAFARSSAAVAPNNIDPSTSSDYFGSNGSGTGKQKQCVGPVNSVVEHGIGITKLIDDNSSPSHQSISATRVYISRPLPPSPRPTPSTELHSALLNRSSLVGSALPRQHMSEKQPQHTSGPLRTQSTGTCVDATVVDSHETADLRFKRGMLGVVLGKWRRS